MTYVADPQRYAGTSYSRCGRSGLLLPKLSLGLWQNFGATRDYDSALEILGYAFDRGITHFDLANNYGPPPGAAEELVGTLLERDFRDYRDELIISTKAGWPMWPGPYGDLGSRKYLIASCDQSLKRLKLDYVDIFYSHRFDPNTPLEETMGALAHLHRQGKALYVGISSYPQEQTRAAFRILKEIGVPCIVHQPSYSILNRWIETDGTLEACRELGIGVTIFSPLAQGILSGKYISGAQPGTRAAENYTLTHNTIELRVVQVVDQLTAIAQARGQTLSQMAISWTLRNDRVTSAILGVRNLAQLQENLSSLNNLLFAPEELDAIDVVTAGGQLDLHPSKLRPFK